MRERCKILVALGDCAVFGGVPAMRNFVVQKLRSNEHTLKPKATIQEGKIPSSPELAEMTRVRAVHEVVPVDLHIPGCPPDADVIFYALV